MEFKLDTARTFRETSLLREPEAHTFQGGLAASCILSLLVLIDFTLTLPRLMLFNQIIRIFVNGEDRSVHFSGLGVLVAGRFNVWRRKPTYPYLIVKRLKPGNSRFNQRCPFRRSYTLSTSV